MIKHSEDAVLVARCKAALATQSVCHTVEDLVALGECETEIDCTLETCQVGTELYQNFKRERKKSMTHD